ADRTAIVNADVPTFARRSGATVKDLPIDHNPGTNARADGGVEDIVIPATCSPAGLGQRGGVRVVIQFDWCGIKLLQGFSQRKISPARHVRGVENDSCFWI